MMQIYIVDAFTETPFTGNPAGVCILEEPIADDVMLRIAQEVKHSETAFVYKHGTEYILRWFTPQIEVPLCGHATLATAHILWEQHYVSRESPIVFRTAAGDLLTVRLVQGMTVMDFPQYEALPVAPPSLLLEGLGVSPVWTGCDDLRYLVELETEQAIIALRPRFDLLTSLGKRVIVTAPASTPAYDFVSRMFASCVGVDEDPVTGSAHCYLAPYWAKKLGKSHLIGYQASSRPGTIACELLEHGRVLLKGTARTVIKGQLLL